MTKENKNMWGDLTDLETIKTPKMFLQEQAEHLRKDTKFILKGEVSSEAISAGRFRVELDIVAPRINNYRYTVVTVRHPLEIYPLTITNEVLTMTMNVRMKKHSLKHLNSFCLQFK